MAAPRAGKESVELQVAQAARLVRRHSYAEADAIYARLLDLDPRHEAALLGRAAIALKLGHPEEIAARCAAAAAVLPGRLDLHRHAVLALIRMKRLPQAKRMLLTMASIDRHGLDTERAAAVVARAKGDRAMALRHTLIALRLLPQDSRLALDAVRDLAALGRVQEAEARLAPLLEARPEHPVLLRQAGTLAQLAGRSEEAVGFYRRAAALQPGHVETLLDLGELLLATGADAQAEAALRQAVAPATDQPAVMLRLAGHLRLLGCEEDARTLLERACRAAPGEPKPWLELARLADQCGAQEAALAILREGRRETGEAAELLLAEASLLFACGRAGEAEACLAEAERRHPEDPAVIARRADRAIAMGLFATAADAIARMPAATPAERARRHEALGRRAEARRRHAEAREEFQAALAEAPGLAAAQEGLARAGLALLQPEEAFASLATSLALQAGAHKVRGRAARPTRGVMGELINEARIDAPAVEAARSAMEAGGWEALLRAHRAAPDLTVTAIAVLTALRLRGALDPSPPRPAGTAIPRRIHQYWDTAAVPPDVTALMASWTDHNPDWTYRRHDRSSALSYLREHLPHEVAHAFRRAHQPAHQADLFRLAVLLAEGGVHADADDRCVAPFDEHLDGPRLLLWQEPLGSVGNNFIAAVPGHPVIAAALWQAVEATLRGDAETLWLSTGPGLLTRALVQHLAGGERRLAEAGREIVVLERWDLREFCMPCCKAAYKARGLHWFSQELVQQPG